MTEFTQPYRPQEGRRFITLEQQREQEMEHEQKRVEALLRNLYPIVDEKDEAVFWSDIEAALMRAFPGRVFETYVRFPADANGETEEHKVVGLEVDKALQVHAVLYSGESYTVQDDDVLLFEPPRND